MLIEIAQQCNVSVRDIHFAARDMGEDLKPTAKEVDSKLAKALIDHFQKKAVEDDKSADKTAKKAPPKKKIKVEAPPKKEPVVKKEKPVKKPAFVVLEKPVMPVRPKVEPPKVAEKKSKPKKVEVKERKARDKYEKIEFKPSKVQQDRPVTKTKKVKKESRKPGDSTISDEILDVAGKRKLDTAEQYAEMLDSETDREIIHTQRKKMAGKDSAKTQKRAPTVSQTIKYDPNRVIEISDAISVKELAEKSGLGPAKIIGELMKNGVLANINQQIDFETVHIIAADLKIKVRKKESVGSAEDLLKGNLASLLLEHEDDDEMKERPPIVVVMGHVDHGKTKLLDAIRETDVVAGESGGITQHVGAYQVEKSGKKITFIDTPGHEAFTAMRARGAKVTDVAILVVAADEGVKPQTIEALQHAKDAGVPIIVAINKIDKPNADIDKVKGELVNYELVPEDWGGKTIMAPVSAMTREGLPDLLEMILLVSEMENLRANYSRPAIGTVIEAHLDQNLGPVATVIVNSGVMKVMDSVVIGESHGRVKVMKDHNGKKLKEAGPSTPLLLAGLTEKAVAGDILQVVPDEKTARMKSISVKNLKAAMQRERGVGEIMSAISSGQLNQLKLVIKADTNGSLEAIKQSLAEIKNEDVAVKVILSSVGDINESDVMMAAASGGIVVGFHTKAKANAIAVAERENVEIIYYDIIYKMLEDVRKILNGMLEPEFVEKEIGDAEVKMIFFSKKKEMIVGCHVKNGYISKGSKLRVLRGSDILGEIGIESLQKGQSTAEEVKEGGECGIKVKGNIKLEEGDVLQAYVIDKKIKTL